MIDLSNKLIKFIVQEHNFKKDVMYKNMTHISNLIVDDSTAQSLTPTINSIMQVSLKNDEIILKLVEILKKYGEITKSIDNEDDIEEDDLTKELIGMIQNTSDEQKELSDQMDRKIKETKKYNEEVKRSQEQIDRLNEIG